MQALYDLLANHTPDPAERDRISKTIAIEGLKRASRVELPSGFYAVAWWPWLENYYGELEPSTASNQSAMMARLWVNSDLKAKLQ